MAKLIFLRTNNLVELERTNPALFKDMLTLHGTKLFQNDKIRGVEITCEGDKKFFHTKQFIDVEVSDTHPIFDDENVDQGLDIGCGAANSKVSEMIGVPLVVSYIPPLVNKFLAYLWQLRGVLPATRWWEIDETDVESNGRNPTAQHFLIDTDATSPDWGTEDPDGKVFERVLVVRRDQLAITANQVEAIAAFLKQASEWFKIVNTPGAMAEYPREGRIKIRQGMMEHHLSREKFEKFFQEFKEKKIKDGDESWKDEKSPYEVVKVEEESDRGARDWDDEDEYDDWSDGDDDIDDNEDIEEALDRLALREPWKDVGFN